MVGQNEGQGGFGNDLTNVMTADSQEELARRFVSFSFFSTAMLLQLIQFGIFPESVINMCHFFRSSQKVKLITVISAIYRFQADAFVFRIS